MQRARIFFQQNARQIAIEVAVNGVLPYVIYAYTHGALGDVRALLASMAPPLLWSAIEFALRRRIDIVAVFSIAGIVLSLLAFAGGGSAKVLQLRENLVTGIIALVFLGSVAIGKPLIAVFASASMSRKSAAEAASFEQLQVLPRVRRSMVVMTIVWGIGLLVQTALACALVFALTIPAYLLVSPVLGYGTMGALALWTYWYVAQQKRIGARVAAERSGRVAGSDVR
jgi:hypothetical protein